MSGKMEEMIRYAQRRFQGASYEDLLEETVAQVVQEREETQQRVEAIFRDKAPLFAEATAHIASTSQAQIDASCKAVRELRTSNSQFSVQLGTATGKLGKSQECKNKLEQDLASLRRIMRHPPPSQIEGTVYEFGKRACSQPKGL